MSRTVGLPRVCCRLLDANVAKGLAIIPRKLRDPFIDWKPNSSITERGAERFFRGVVDKLQQLIVFSQSSDEMGATKSSSCSTHRPRYLKVRGKCTIVPISLQICDINYNHYYFSRK